MAQTVADQIAAVFGDEENTSPTPAARLAALQSLTDRYPYAPMAAMNGDGLVVEMPESLPLRENPVLQGRRYDPHGAYVRRWVPELASYPDRWIHSPWEAPERPLDAADYPDPIVDHQAERDEALARYEAVRSA